MTLKIRLKGSCYFFNIFDKHIVSGSFSALFPDMFLWIQFKHHFISRKKDGFCFIPILFEYGFLHTLLVLHSVFSPAILRALGLFPLSLQCARDYFFAYPNRLLFLFLDPSFVCEMLVSGESMVNERMTSSFAS